MSRWIGVIGMAMVAAMIWGRVPEAAGQTKSKADPAKSSKPAKRAPAKSKPESKPAPKSQSKPAPERAATPGTGAVTRAEAEALAKRINAAAAERDFAQMGMAIDEPEFINRALAGLNLPPRARGGIASGLRFATMLPQTIHTQIGDVGSYRLLRVLPPKDAGGAPRPLFRMSSPAGINYHELHLHRNAAGEVRIADLYAFSTGETMSQTVRGFMLPSLPRDGSVKMTKEMEAIAASSETIVQMRQHLQAARHAEAMALYQGLPDVLKATKAIGVIRVMIAAGLDEAQYAAAMEDYRKQFPGGAEIDLMSIDATLLKQDFDGALAAIDRVDKHVGGDPFLDHYRATVAFEKGDVEGARALLRKVIKADPSLPDSYQVLAVHLVAAEEYAEAAAVMLAGERQANVRWTDVEQSPDYAGFVQSPEYAKWKAARAVPEGDGLD